MPCFCGQHPCPHTAFTGDAERHCVAPTKQDKSDREQAEDFFHTIEKGKPLASPGDLKDSASGAEPLWLAIADGDIKVAEESFRGAGGAGASGMRTILPNWAYVDITWLNKIKTDSAGNVHFEAWRQPHGERTVLTKPKIICVSFEWQSTYEVGGRTRYVLSASDYQRFLDAVAA